MQIPGGGAVKDKRIKRKILILNTIKHPKIVNGVKNAVRDDKFS